MSISTSHDGSEHRAEIKRVLHLVERILCKQENTMSALTDAQAAIAALTSEVSLIAADVTNAVTKIDSLLSQITSGSVAEADVAKLAAEITAQTQALSSAAVALEKAAPAPTA